MDASYTTIFNNFPQSTDPTQYLKLSQTTGELEVSSQSLGWCDRFLYLFGFGAAGVTTVVNKIHEITNAKLRHIEGNSKELANFPANESYEAFVKRTSHGLQGSTLQNTFSEMYTTIQNEERVISKVHASMISDCIGRFSLTVSSIVCFIKKLFCCSWICSSQSIFADRSLPKKRLLEMLAYEYKEVTDTLEPSAFHVWYGTLKKEGNTDYVDYNIHLKMDFSSDLKMLLVLSKTEKDKDKVSLGHVEISQPIPHLPVMIRYVKPVDDSVISKSIMSKVLENLVTWSGINIQNLAHEELSNVGHSNAITSIGIEIERDLDKLDHVILENGIRTGLVGPNFPLLFTVAQIINPMSFTAKSK